MPDKINQRIKDAREKLGLKQYQVAQLLDMKESTYSQMERSGKINSERIVELSKILNVSTDYLLTGETPLDFSPLDNSNSVLKEEPFYESEPQITLSQNEISIITILRNFPKNVREEVIDFIEQKYKETK